MKFKCPKCRNDISIDGITYKMCPICKYFEDTEKKELIIHEETIEEPTNETLKDFIKRGLMKLGKAMTF